MAIPNVTFDIQDNGLGLVPPSPAGTIAIIGCSQGGTAATVSGPYGDTGSLLTEYGYGPGPELAAQLIQSGIPTIFLKVATNTAGAAGSVTHTGTGLSVMTVTSQAIFDVFSVVVTVVRAGTAGSDPEPGFTISLDGGRTKSSEIRMPANRIYSGIEATTGIELNFTAATLVVGDTYTFATTGPTWAVADVVTALEALRSNAKNASLLYVVGTASRSDANTIATTVNSFDDRKKFIRAVIEAADIGSGQTEQQWMTAVENAFAGFEQSRLVVAAGGHLNVSAINGVNFRRNIGWLGIVRAGLVSISTDLAAVADGALLPNSNGVPVSVVYHDEALVPGLDADKFMTVRSFNGLTGYYITNPNLMSGPTSDFSLLQLGRVMDEACRLANVVFTQRLSSAVRVRRDTGRILERDALTLEAESDSVLQSGLRDTGDVSDVWTIVSRSDSILTTHKLNVTVKIIPLGYLKEIAIVMTYTNPAVTQLAA